ncbi:hypothetical protein N7445_008757 [Penicillium cf. griseofulvum]|nr:hypothetical protein N7445_008757 [Penicillium cf. griseofulvum]
MPMRPNLLASRRTQSSIAKHSGLPDRSISNRSLRWGLVERRRGHYTCERSVSRLRYVPSPNTSSSHPPLMPTQSKRKFSNTTRKEGIWDDDDEFPEPKPVQRLPGRPNFVRSVQHRDLRSLIRSRLEGKNRVSERLRIEKQVNSLPSYHGLVDSFIQLKYKHVDDLLAESAKTTQKYVTEWESRSNFIRAQFVTMVSDATDSVLQAEKITQEYIAEVIGLSSSILGRIQAAVTNAEKITQKYIAEVIDISSSILSPIQAAVTKAENTGRMIDHDFCCIAFARTPELQREVLISARTIRGWRKSFRTTQMTLLEPLVNISELAIREWRDTIRDNYLIPRDTARSRIDRVLHESELIDKNYVELRLKSTNAQIFAIKNLCLDLQQHTNLRSADRRVFIQYSEILHRCGTELSVSAHSYRAVWLRRQMAFHSLRKSELWNLHDFTAAVSSARSSRATDPSVVLALALGAPNKSPAGQHLHNSPRLISNKICLQYKHLWTPKPARSSELHIYWRQLDVIAPLRMTDVITWRLHNEVWYLHHSLRGDCGELWCWVPREALRHHVSKVADWSVKFQEHRSELRKMTANYIHVNWLRLQSETLLHSMGEPAYLAGKFEVLNPVSQDISRFKQWADRMGKLTTEAHNILTAARMPRKEWDFVHSKIHSTIGGAFANPKFLELGSSANKPRRRKGREGSGSRKVKAALIRSSQSRLWRYTKGQLSGNPESPPASQDNRVPGQDVKPSRLALKRRRRRQLRKISERQHTADLATNQGIQEDSRLGHKLNPSTPKAEDHTTEGKLVTKPLPVDAPIGQDNQEDSPVSYKPSPKLRKRKYMSYKVPELNPSLVNAPASQRNQGGSQVLPKQPPIPSKIKEVSLNTESHLDDLRPPIPRETSNGSLGTRTHNGLRPALMLPRKPFAKPEPNHGRKYSTNAVYQTKLKQSGSVSDNSLPERPVEDALSSVPDTTTGDRPGFIEKIDSAVEPIPPSDIGFSANNLTTPQFWSHSSHQSPDGRKLIVHYCRSLQSTEDAVQHFLESKVIGFDMEWKAQASSWDSIQSNVSVIQIANEERIALFQVALFKPARSLDDLVSPSLKRLIESPDVIKVGVAIKADCTRLRKYLGIDARATFELSHLYKLIKYGKDDPKLVNKRGVNLSEQINEHFGLPLEKSDDVRCGDWTRALSYRQVQYAATDPYACVRLFHTMEAKRQAMDPVPPRPAYAELNQPIVLPLGQAVNSDEDPLI